MVALLPCAAELYDTLDSQHDAARTADGSPWTFGGAVLLNLRISRSDDEEKGDRTLWYHFVALASSWCSLFRDPKRQSQGKNIPPGIYQVPGM